MIFSLNEKSKYRLMNPTIIKPLIQFKITCPSNFLTLNNKKLNKIIKLPRNCSTKIVNFVCSPTKVSNEILSVKNNKTKPIIENNKV